MDLSYVLITPARNEEKYIEHTLKSVVAQTILPRRWIVVNDNSTDRTGEIVERYARDFPFLRLVTVRNRRKREFSSKVFAFNAGYAALDVPDYRFIGNLDADVSFGPEYYERIMGEFARTPGLGIAGGLILERQNGQMRERFANRYGVSGAVQVFARECYEAIGGYLPMRYGGEDPVSQYMARMHGWKVRTVPELKVIHHRPTGTAQGTLLRACFRAGAEEYTYGSHPLFQVVKCIHRLRERPYVLSGLSRMGGYLYAFLRRDPRVPAPVIRFIRKEQMRRLTGGKPSAGTDF
jgi:glycosyltransferase involved in cell wall biosynthesis